MASLGPALPSASWVTLGKALFHSGFKYPSVHWVMGPSSCPSETRSEGGADAQVGAQYGAAPWPCPLSPESHQGGVGSGTSSCFSPTQLHITSWQRCSISALISAPSKAAWPAVPLTSARLAGGRSCNPPSRSAGWQAHATPCHLPAPQRAGPSIFIWSPRIVGPTEGGAGLVLSTQ